MNAPHSCAYCASTVHATGVCPFKRRWIHKASAAEVSTLGGFPILYADPPWAYSDKKCNGAAEWHYRTMENGAIAQIPVWDLAAADAVLFMWGTYPLLAEMLELGKAWGFTYKSIAFQWVKRYAKSGDPFFGLGRWTRGNTEGCFLFTKGKPKRVHNGVSQLVEEWAETDLPVGLLTLAAMRWGSTSAGFQCVKSHRWLLGALRHRA